MEKRGKWRGERKVFDVKEGKEGDYFVLLRKIYQQNR